MAIRIILNHSFRQQLPIIHSFRFYIIPLVCHRPPYISKRSQTSSNIFNITYIHLIRHSIKAPSSLIIRMEKDQIRLNPQTVQLVYPFLQMLKKAGSNLSKSHSFLSFPSLSFIVFLISKDKAQARLSLKNSF